MIEKFSLGIDVTDINQFKKIPYTKKPSFYQKLFLTSEINYCLKFKNSHTHFAGKFALKEAVKKSIPEKITMLEIKTFHSKSKPTIKLMGKRTKKYNFIASVSHENNLAIAIVLAEKV